MRISALVVSLSALCLFSASSIAAEKAVAPKKKKGDEFCSTLERYLDEAKTKFSGMARTGRDGKDVTLKLPGALDCTVLNTSTQTFLSCEMFATRDAASAKTHYEGLVARVKGCLGSGWSSESDVMDDMPFTEFNRASGGPFIEINDDTDDDGHHVNLDVIAE